MATVGKFKVKHGALKAFREYLNSRHSDMDFGAGKGKWRSGAYGNRTRKYGDWLYHQDRVMFDELLGRALEGRAEEEFNGKEWKA